VIKQRIILVMLSAGFVWLLGVVVLGERPAEGQEAVLRARAIELVDDRGQVRAQLNVEGDGAVFRLRDQNGTIRTKLGGGVDGSGLLLANQRAEVGAHIVATRRRTALTLRRGGRRKVLKP
jgi:transposase